MRKVILILLIQVCCSLHVFPDEADRDSTIHIEEVIVSGFKQEGTLNKASSITNISHYYLQSYEIKSIKELSAYVPNFFVPDYGTKQNTPVYVRGIGSKINAPSVGFYVDGIPHFEKSAFDIDISEISSIEILRGPQGTLYGRNAIGGIINIYTHSPLDYQNTRIKLGYGSKNNIEASLANYTKLSKHLGFSIMGKYHQNDGYFKNASTGEAADDIRNGTGRVSIVWKPTQAWTFRLGTTVDLSKQGGYPYGIYDIEEKVWAGVNYDAYSSYRRTMAASGLTIGYQGSNFCISSQTSHQYIDDKQGIDQDFSPASKYFVEQTLKQQMWSEELTLKSARNGRYHWISGLFAFSQEIDNTAEMSYLQQGYSTPKFYGIPTRGTAFYHQSSFDITATMSASIGLRYDYEKSENSSHAYKKTADGTRKLTNRFKSELKSDLFTPKFTLMNKFADSRIIYASIARGYKAGGYNQAFTTDNERSFGPEFSWNYEIGTKLSFFDNALKTELCLFYIDWKNQQISQTVPGIGNIQCNAGHSESKGIEFAMITRPLYGLDLQVNYGYTYAKFLEYHKSSTVNYSSNMLPMVPRNTFSAAANYNLYHLGSFLDRLTFCASVSGVGKLYWTEDNTSSQSLYTLLNAKIIANKGKFTLEVWSKNITNNDYISYYFVSSANCAQKGKPTSYGTALIINL